jgi:hypothetical protein
MPSIVTIKWGKQEYPDIEVDANGSVADLKAVLMSLTGEDPLAPVRTRAGSGCKVFAGAVESSMRVI